MIRLADIDLTNRARILNLKNPVSTKEPVPLGYGDSRYALQTFTVNGHSLSGPLEIIASEVPVVPTGGLSSTNVQAALEELQGDISATDLSLHSVTELSDVTDAGSGAIITTEERDKLNDITITQSVDLDTLESDVESLLNNKIHIVSSISDLQNVFANAEGVAVIYLKNNIVFPSGDITTLTSNINLDKVYIFNYNSWLFLDSSSELHINSSNNLTINVLGKFGYDTMGSFLIRVNNPDNSTILNILNYRSYVSSIYTTLNTTVELNTYEAFYYMSPSGVGDGTFNFNNNSGNLIPYTNTITDLSIDNITNVSLDILSSDGDDVTVPAATEITAGLLTGTDKTKLNTVEEGADVTNATNVEAAGAVMETDISTTNMSFVVDEDDMVSNSNTKIPTQQSVKTYIDNVTKQYIYFDGYNMSTSVVGTNGHIYKNSTRLDNSDEEASTSLYNTFSSGLLIPYRAYETIDIVKIGISCKAACVNTGTVGASPTMRFALYTMDGTSRTLIGNIDIPVSPTGSIGIYGDLGGTTLIEGELSISLGTLSLSNSQLFGIEFVSRGSTNEEIYGFSKMTMYIKGQKI